MHLLLIKQDLILSELRIEKEHHWSPGYCECPWPAKRECNHVCCYQPLRNPPPPCHLWSIQRHASAGCLQWSARSCVLTSQEGASRHCHLGQWQFLPGCSSLWLLHKQPKIQQHLSTCKFSLPKPCRGFLFQHSDGSYKTVTYTSLFRYFCWCLSGVNNVCKGIYP